MLLFFIREKKKILEMILAIFYLIFFIVTVSKFLLIR